ncbi:hypothetical protein FACS189413_16750 [Bacteroidia bacterium]|nr:hypothetical protein FACS189413_16750 [Bacteroidia bacterium]
MKHYLRLPNGIPSHDTFNRFFSALDPEAFEQAFLSWIKDISELTDGDVISIDGKTLCGCRIEQRKCTLYNDLSFIDNASAWKNLTAIVKIKATRYIKSSGKEEKEVRIYITSSKETAQIIGSGARSHWGIENNLHWQLDVSFNEDESRKREGYTAQKFSLLIELPSI